MTPSDLADRVREAAAVRPSARQVAWQQTEFAAFVHFGPNTFTDREWGLGREDPALFAPSALDADQWVRAFAGAGMRGVILTCKHHDGFALWPTSTGRHSVASTPWRDGHGDLVAEVAAACAAHGLKFGVYVSPWDRFEPTYGSGAAYDDVFVTQLTELLTGYGPLYSVWFDGANGEGPDGRHQAYDWDRYVSVIRRLQPGAAISVCGPDVRWCGNEAGHTRENEWSVVPAAMRDIDRIAHSSQQVDDGEFARRILVDDEDLGSRAALAATDEPLVWYPAEVNTSIRPGWFHHAEEDSAVRSAAELFGIYRRSVGGNAALLLNVPPDRRGLVADPDLAALDELGGLIRGLDERDVAPAAAVGPSSAAAPSLADGWRPSPDDPSPTVTLRWAEPQRIDGVGIRERITDGQQIERLEVWGRGPGDAAPHLLARAGAVGYQRILDLDPVEVTELAFVITQRRAVPTVTAVRVFAAS